MIESISTFDNFIHTQQFRVDRSPSECFWEERMNCRTKSKPTRAQDMRTCKAMQYNLLHHHATHYYFICGWCMLSRFADHSQNVAAITPARYYGLPYWFCTLVLWWSFISLNINLFCSLYICIYLTVYITFFSPQTQEIIFSQCAYLHKKFCYFKQHLN